MAIKIKQLIVNGKLKSDLDEENIESKSNQEESVIDKINELKEYVDKTVDASFKEICDTTTDQILENIYKKSDF